METTVKTVQSVKKAADLEALAKLGRETLESLKPKVMVGMASCGIAAGAEEVYKALLHEAQDQSFEVTKTGCLGFCQVEPLVSVSLPKQGTVILKKVTAQGAAEIAKALKAGNLPAKDTLCTLNGTPRISGESGKGAVPSYEELGFFKKQKKIALRNCGFINPDSIAEYAARGGYKALLKALTSMKPQEVIDTVKKAGLRGRGGAGFPTGVKWEITAKQPEKEKFIICNADEGDPGAYMDRSILEGDPHSVLEGMLLGAYAMGASQGVVYVRDEYPQAIEKLEKALSDARAAGLLGKNIAGSKFSFDLRIVRGGGAFVCGEETALIASVMGQPGEPSQRPPFPAQSGLWGKPTNINNVETWANVPYIIQNGAESFNSLGTKTSKGTKVFSLVGKISNTGLIEVPMGLTLRETVFEIGGGVLNGKKFKAVQTGGPSGGCLPENLLDLPVDYEQLNSAGTIMGSGGMIVMDEETCMVDVARYFLDFLKEESCGKCTPCREGISKMLDILNKICEGKGTEKDLALLEETAQAVKDFSLCGLGQTAPNPVLTTLRYFRKEYESHIKDHRCPAGVCKNLVTYRIDAEKCTGCTLCVSVCPSNSISGEKKKPHKIDLSTCIKCAACYEVCNFGAIIRE